jgi:hypothetical protein
MKQLAMLFAIAMLMFSISCARNNQQLMGAMGGAAGAGAALYQGLNPTALAIYTIGGLTAGMYVGDAIDQKKQKDRDNDQYYAIERNRQEAREEADRLWKEAEARQSQVNVYNASGGSGSSYVNPGNTNCEKVTRRQWRGNQVISETTEEVCRGQRNTSMY